MLSEPDTRPQLDDPKLLARAQQLDAHLDALVVQVPPLEAITGDMLYARYEALRQEKRQRIPKPEGSVLAFGDEVVLDTVALIDGKPVPFSAARSRTVQAVSGIDAASRHLLVLSQDGNEVVLEYW